MHATQYGIREVLSSNPIPRSGFFFEYAGELSIFEFKEKNSPITKHHTPPWTRMGIMNKGLKNELLQIKLHERPDPQLF